MENLYADVIIDIAHEKVDRPFQYKIPNHLKDILEIGMEVEIPFGAGNTLRAGYVIDMTDTPSYPPEKLKEIKQLSEKGMSVERSFIQLAYWMKTQYGSTMITALKTVLPVKQKIKHLEKKTVTLCLSKEDAEKKAEFFHSKHQVARERLLRALIEEGALILSVVTGKLNITAKTVEALAEQGIIQVTGEMLYRIPEFKKDNSEQRFTLSREQSQIAEDIDADKNGSVHLLHGITGSGKTEVYMELIAKAISKRQQAIVLIPEIALTFQTVMRFYRRFGDRVSIMHSKLSKGERFDQMQRAKNGEVDIVIGPRSALFTPFSQVGLIIIDEEHESSYKSETMPKYHAREVAMKIAQMQGAKVVLGSATPSLEAFYAAKRGAIRYYELTRRLTGGTLPTVYTEDLREELKAGNRSILSRRLQEMIQKRLERKEQIMLFLNRRGYAGFVSCRACGQVMKCPHCAVSLSEHRNGSMQCHYCGYSVPKPVSCPSCGSKYILGFRAGTQQIEETLLKEYPNARILRMDADSTKTKDSYEEILSAFANREADILVGTQMIVKGHDFPNVTLVGILAADLSLAANDYRAGERTFQLLTQAAGRAGRGEKPGEVVIQTYQPEHYSIVHAAKQDYIGFYEEEILYRELMGYPPAAGMMAVLVTSKEEAAGKTLAQNIAELVQRKAVNEKVSIIGPAPAGIGKINDVYRFVLYIKHKERRILTAVKDGIEKYLKENASQEEMVQFDFNPMSAY